MKFDVNVNTMNVTVIDHGIVRIGHQPTIERIITCGAPHTIEYRNYPGTANAQAAQRVAAVPPWVYFLSNSEKLLRYAVKHDLGDALTALGDDRNAVQQYVISRRNANQKP